MRAACRTIALISDWAPLRLWCHEHVVLLTAFVACRRLQARRADRLVRAHGGPLYSSVRERGALGSARGQPLDGGSASPAAMAMGHMCRSIREVSAHNGAHPIQPPQTCIICFQKYASKHTPIGPRAPSDDAAGEPITHPTTHSHTAPQPGPLPPRADRCHRSPPPPPEEIYGSIRI